MKSQAVRHATLLRQRKQGQARLLEQPAARRSRVAAAAAATRDAALASTRHMADWVRQTATSKPTEDAHTPPAAALAGSPRQTPLCAEDFPTSPHGDTEWSRVARWASGADVPVEERREDRVVTVVAAPDSTSVWVLWEDRLHVASLCDLFPYPLTNATRALEWLAVAVVPSALVCLPDADGAPAPTRLQSRMDPVLHHQTVPMHARSNLWTNPLVHSVVSSFSAAANWLSKRAQLMFSQFVRLLVAGAPGPYGVSAGTFARLRTWYRRCFSLCNPASAMYGKSLEELRAARASSDSGSVGDVCEEDLQEEEEEEEEESSDVEGDVEGEVEGDGSKKCPSISPEAARALDAPVWVLLVCARDMMVTLAPCPQQEVEAHGRHLVGMASEVDALAIRGWDALVGHGMTGSSLEASIRAHASQQGGAPAAAIRRVLDSEVPLERLAREVCLIGKRDGSGPHSWLWTDILTLYCLRR